MNNYKEILSQEKFSRRVKNICRADKSMLLDDIVSEFYMFCYDENLNVNKLEDDIIINFLKELHSKIRKNSHSPYLEEKDTIIEEEEEEQYIKETHNIEDMLNDENLLKECHKFNFTQEEMLCLLYLQDNKNIKNYNYNFIKKNTANSIDKSKLSKYYENIIKKLLQYFSKEVL